MRLFPRRDRLEALIQRLHLDDDKAARARRLNPYGAREGQMILGVRRHTPMAVHGLMRGGITVEQFIRAHGREAYRALPGAAFMRFGHRKLIRVWAARSNPRAHRYEQPAPELND